MSPKLSFLIIGTSLGAGRAGRRRFSGGRTGHTVCMQIGATTPIGDVDGFRVEAPGGRIGWVEEMWLDDDGETTAAVVRLPNARRGLLVHDDIDEILPGERAITVRPGARLLELDPPHLGTGADGALEASWATSGNALALPELRPAPQAARPASTD